MTTRHRSTATKAVLLVLALAGGTSVARAQEYAGPDAPAAAAAAQAPSASPSLEIYGFAQADAIFDFRQNDPNWFDVLRPTKLPSFEDQFGEDGRFYLSVRQSKFGTRTVVPTSDGDVTAVFEFDMFGTGADAGQTTIRLRHAFGQWQQFGAGQTNSQFTDVEVFPNSLDYWGPNGMLFFRNVQVFWEPFNDGSSRARVAIERPGASGDAGQLADRIELQNIRPRFPVPDFTGHYRSGYDWGYVQVGGALRYIAYDDLLTTDPLDLSGHVWGWGFAGSSNVKVTPSDTLRLMAVYGEGIQNYFNDAPVDVGIERNPGNAVTPVVGTALPIFGLVAFLDHTWAPGLTSAVGYSRIDITNSDGQAPSAFKNGQYMLFNLLTNPVDNVTMGAEFQWIDRENFSDGFSVDDFRLQFTFRYNFSAKVGG